MQDRHNGYPPQNGGNGGGPPNNGWIALYERLTRVESYAMSLDQRIVLISADNRALRIEMKETQNKAEKKLERMEAKVQAAREAHQRVLIKILWGMVSLVGVAMFQWVWAQMTTGTIR